MTGYGFPAEYETTWHKWFAWHPVEVDSKRVWLKKVYRVRRWSKHSTQDLGRLSYWEYGTILDVLKDES